MKILTIIGARPQFIKAATISRVVKEKEGVEEVIVHTGQHFDENMSDIFFDELNIPRPQYNLGIGGGTHGAQTGEMLIEIEKVLFEEKPNVVLVYGDTNSTLAGALAASKIHIPVVHVEAGLRSFNMKMPEEQNRILTDNISSMLFTPTYTADNNLKNEGFQPDKIMNVGDVMYDAVLFYSDLADKKSSILQEYNLESKNFILSTIHRAENTNDEVKLLKIFENLDQVSKQHTVVLPLHPRTKNALSSIGYNLEESSIIIIPPVGYFDMVMLEKHSKLIITDSGGVQKEAYFHKVPCVTLRDETEWVELIEQGYNFLSPDLNLLKDSNSLDNIINIEISGEDNLYGNGKAAYKIVELLQNRYV